jgi:tRNA(Ile)-lysidine synthase
VSTPPLTNAEIDAVYGPLLQQGQPATWVLAVSGGVDSSAMLHLAAEWVHRHPGMAIALVVATVDHGLRTAAAAEAEAVAQAAAGLGLPHVILSWTGTKPSTGVQAAARAARYQLLQTYAAAQAVQPAHILTAHTADDQAETVLMRLARGSGVDGLAAMRPVRLLPGGIKHVRPLLDVTKAQLLATLRAREVSWSEDPSNSNPASERVRLRQWLKPWRAAAEPGNLDVMAVARSARRLDRANTALEALTAQLWTDCAHANDGAYVSIDRSQFDSSPAELQVRLLGRAVALMGGSSPAVELSQLEHVVAGVAVGPLPGLTLGGALVRANRRHLSVFREPGRTGLPRLELAPGDSALWDGRYRVGLAATAVAPVSVRAFSVVEWATLRRQLAIDPARRPGRAALTVPTFWRHADLIAVPWLGALGLHPEEPLTAALIQPSAGVASGGR